MKRVAVVGASGFVGAHLVPVLCQKYQVIALTRSRPENLPAGVEWRAVDLYSAQSTFDALKNVDAAVYLIHSMLPSSELFQGSFHDTDLLLADNFARACAAHQVKQIVYLGGLMPEGYVSPHLQSRHEVEEVLAGVGVSLTVLRAGLIVGSSGSSFQILKTLVQRLPFMVLPEWTQKTTQAVFIDDVVRVIAESLADSRFQGRVFDVVNGEPLTYEILLRQMAVVLKKKRRMFAVPIRSTGFSKLWVQLFGSSSRELVSPLIDSLLCDLPQVSPDPLLAPLIQFRHFTEMAAKTLERDREVSFGTKRKKRLRANSVRSIQRLPTLLSHHCDEIAEEYMKWIPRFLPFILRVRTGLPEDKIEFSFSFFFRPLLILQYIPDRFEDDRRKFHIVGGILTKTSDTGWLEFRQISHRKYTLAALHEFVPSLPWYVYVLTQAPLHVLAMRAFGKHLSRFAENARLLKNPV